MSKISIDENRCKGCLLCALACPKGIIARSERINKKGYKVAEVKEELMQNCTGCTSCALMCPDVAITVWRTSSKSASKEVNADAE